MNELEIKFWTKDGRKYDVERGVIDADIGYESHGMFVMKLKFDWGIYTYNSILLDRLISFGETCGKSEHEIQPYAHALIKAMLEVCNVDYFSSIKNREVYLLFDGKDRCPVGIVNVHDIQKSLIFNDLIKATS